MTPRERQNRAFYRTRSDLRAIGGYPIKDQTSRLRE